MCTCEIARMLCDCCCGQQLETATSWKVGASRRSPNKLWASHSVSQASPTAHPKGTNLLASAWLQAVQPYSSTADA